MVTETIARGAAVSISHLHHAFTLGKQTVPVLENISLQLRPGESVALLGPQAQGKKGLEAKADALIDRIGLQAFSEAWPRQLSGGMAQRAALARALLNEPRLLLLDEPLGKLDSLTRISMQRELIALWQLQGYTSLLVTHDIEEALLLCERVLVMSPRPGRIIAEFALPLAFPRHRDNPQLLQHRQDILRILGQEADW